MSSSLHSLHWEKQEKKTIYIIYDYNYLLYLQQIYNYLLCQQ